MSPRIDAPPTDAEVTAGLRAWFSDFGEVAIRNLCTDPVLRDKMRAAAMAMREARKES